MDLAMALVDLPCPRVQHRRRHLHRPNPKSEYRNPEQTRVKIPKGTDLEFSAFVNFNFVSNFEFVLYASDA